MQAAPGSPGLLNAGGSLQHAGNKALLGVLACMFRDVQVRVHSSVTPPAAHLGNSMFPAVRTQNLVFC